MVEKLKGEFPPPPGALPPCHRRTLKLPPELSASAYRAPPRANDITELATLAFLNFKLTNWNTLTLLMGSLMRLR